MKQKAEHEDENKEVLRNVVEFLAKQGLPFRGHRDDKIDFSSNEVNRGNFLAIMQLLAKGNIVLQKHLALARRNAKYTSKTIQNDIIHIIICKQN